jgi:hypothetical protein
VDNVVLDNKVNISKEKIITDISFLLYLGAIIYGLFLVITNADEFQKGLLIMVESFVGVLISAILFLIKKYKNIKISASILFFIHSFVIMAVIGEMFMLYYTVHWWDAMLHLFTGVGIAFTAYCIFDFLTRNSNLEHRFVVSLISALTMALALELLWEFAEFLVDTFFSSNMQKFIPDMPPFFNGGSSDKVLGGTDREIADFFRNPEGYKYALIDTMEDLILNLIGTFTFGVICIFTHERFNNFYSSGFVNTNLQKE